MDTGSKKFMDTAAIIKYLDLVITTDTSIAHLAGSLALKHGFYFQKFQIGDG